MHNAPIRLAIVDDDASVRRALIRLARSMGLEPTAYASGEELLEGAAKSLPDAVLLDLHLPGTRGPDLLAALRAQGIGAPVVVMTGLDRPGARQLCLDAGAVAFIAKPVTRADLVRLFELPGEH
jgi:FixJ family two-component response regulator